MAFFNLFIVKITFGFFLNFKYAENSLNLLHFNKTRVS